MEFMERLEGIPSFYRWLAIPGFVVLMAALYWYFLYQPYIEEIQVLQETISAKRQTVEKHRRIAAKLDTFKAQVSDLETKLHICYGNCPKAVKFLA